VLRRGGCSAWHRPPSNPYAPFDTRSRASGSLWKHTASDFKEDPFEPPVCGSPAPNFAHYPSALHIRRSSGCWTSQAIRGSNELRPVAGWNMISYSPMLHLDRTPTGLVNLVREKTEGLPSLEVPGNAGRDSSPAVSAPTRLRDQRTRAMFHPKPSRSNPNPIMMTRRQAIRSTALIAAASAVAPAVLAQSKSISASATAVAQVVSGPFMLPPLPYAFDALEPHIDARTMEIHHDKHHATYVTNLNKAIAEAPDLGKKSVEDLLMDLNAVPETIRTAVRNHGGGHCNHTLFWQMMKKGGGGEPKGDLAKAMEKQFGSYSSFKDKLTETATKVFGSGWAWLALGPGGQLIVEPTPNQDTPLSAGKQPLLGLDVWEHAYYLKYQNRRPDYIAAWFNVINWDFVAERYARLKG
jgi:superoxide dismutase, Fe-Mn family